LKKCEGNEKKTKNSKLEKCEKNKNIGEMCK